MKLGFVIPWFGRDIPGGAEAECRLTARHLHRSGLDVEILTTCIREFQSDWNVEHYRPGVEDYDGLPIRRFRTTPQDDIEGFARLNRRLMAGERLTPAEETVFMRNIVRSEELVEYMRAHRDEYVYVAIPYMFGTSYWGTLACPERTVLIPCLHDEGYAYMVAYKPMFEQAAGIVFHVPAEQRLAKRLYDLKPGRGVLLGEGVNTDFESRPERFREKYKLGEYLLCAGRKDATKNVPQLVEFFSRYRATTGRELKLVLIGPGEVPVPAGHERDVVDLGFVPTQDKYDAYGGAAALCQPSLNESFSLVVMEAWIAGSPVLVNADCAVTRDHCVASNGGLFFTDYAEFSGCIDYLLDHPAERQRMAENGARYVRANYAWPKIVEKFRAALNGWGFALK